MSINLLASNVTATTAWQALGTLLASAGFTNLTNSSVTTSEGYIRNNDTALNMYIGFGTSAPTYYATIGPKAQMECVAGINLNQVWIKSASSTVSVDFVEGAQSYSPPLINGVIGEITATENVVPKANASGDLVASSISDDGSTTTIADDLSVTGTIISDDATTPGLTIESGNTNTGYVDIKGKTSGKIRITTADATAQTVNITAAAQTSGAGTITIPDLAGASTAPVFTGLDQSITGVKTMTNPVLTAPVVNGATTAAAANNFDFSTGSGTFLTSTGANTLSGAVTVADATTPSVTLASGKTNTGFLLINGKTSGSTKIITADSTAQAVVISTAAQTVGGSTLTIPNQLGVNTSFAFINQYLAAEVTADVTNNTATMANLTDLTLTLQASGIYVGSAVFKCNDSTAAEGISIDFDGGNATMTAFAAGAGVLTGGTTVAVTTVSSALATDLNWTTITGETWITVQFGFTVNGAGTLIPRFCQGTAHTSGTATVSRGSYIRLQKV